MPKVDGVTRHSIPDELRKRWEGIPPDLSPDISAVIAESLRIAKKKYPDLYEKNLKHFRSLWAFDAEFAEKVKTAVKYKANKHAHRTLGDNSTEVQCNHCQLIGLKSGMLRYHFNNCTKPINSNEGNITRKAKMRREVLADQEKTDNARRKQQD